MPRYACSDCAQDLFAGVFHDCPDSHVNSHTFCLRCGAHHLAHGVIHRCKPVEPTPDEQAKAKEIEAWQAARHAAQLAYTDLNES